MTRRLDQLVAAMAPHDAVSDQAFAWRELLARHGIGGEIYAEHVHHDLRADVLPLTKYQGGAPVLMRYSLWSKAAERYLAEDGPHARLMLYHNITPSHLLSENPAIAQLCEEGRQALPAIVAHSHATVADSRYNAAELEECGARDPVVLPLLFERAETTRPIDPHPAHRAVVVGRCVPSKQIELVVRTAALMRRRMPDFRVDVVGSWNDFPRYRESVESLIRTLAAEDMVVLRGLVSREVRDRLYQQAGCYLTLSAHEGFCAPIIEALAEGLPVVSGDEGSLPETLGQAGIVVPGSDPVYAAEAVYLMLTDPELRTSFEPYAQARVRDTAATAIAPRVVEFVDTNLAARGG